MRRCGDEHGVNVAPLQHLAEIHIPLARLAAGAPGRLRVVFVHALYRALAALAPHIADGEHLHVGPRAVTAGDVGPRAAEQMAAALAADADEAHRDAFARRDRAAQAERGGWNEKRKTERRARALHKIAP